ncbi:MAG: hypothetical protein MUO76_05270, partial [Anaerolineaceae bacterium]|nr:hypothetical protein [Anaerolineaceae bacterium]
MITPNEIRRANKGSSRGRKPLRILLLIILLSGTAACSLVEINESDLDIQATINAAVASTLQSITPVCPTGDALPQPAAVPTSESPASTPVTVSNGTPPYIAGCAIFPADNIWNTPVDSLPVEDNS